MPQQWKVIVHVYKKGDKQLVITVEVISLLSTTYTLLFNILLSKSICRWNYWGPSVWIST